MLNFANLYKGLPKSIYILFIVQIVNRFGDFVSPFLTLYLTKKLGLSFETTGLIIMAGFILGAAGSLVCGKFADQLGRKRVYILIQTIAGMSLVPGAFFQNNPFVIVICVLIATFFNVAVGPLIASMIADMLPPDKRQVGYSLNYLGINLGVSLGPLVAGFLFNNCVALLFIGDAMTSFVAVCLVVMYVTDIYVTAQEVPATAKENDESGNIAEVLWRRPQVIIFFLIYIIYSVVYIQYSFSLPITLDSRFLARGPEIFGSLMSVNALTVMTLATWITIATKKFKPLNNIVMAGVLFAIGFGIIGVISTFSMFIISTILWTAGEILISTNFRVYIANNSPRNYRARFAALGNLSIGIGRALGTSVIGQYIGVIGINAVWPLIFILAATASVFMFLLSSYSNRFFHGPSTFNQVSK